MYYVDGIIHEVKRDLLASKDRVAGIPVRFEKLLASVGYARQAQVRRRRGDPNSPTTKTNSVRKN